LVERRHQHAQEHAAEDAENLTMAKGDGRRGSGRIHVPSGSGDGLSLERAAVTSALAPFGVVLNETPLSPVPILRQLIEAREHATAVVHFNCRGQPT
jgi:hypothetical protein